MLNSRLGEAEPRIIRFNGKEYTSVNDLKYIGFCRKHPGINLVFTSKGYNYVGYDVNHIVAIYSYVDSLGYIMDTENP